jgi:hypothetical protein
MGRPTGMNSPFTGGCYCGIVRYECTAQPAELQMFRCHCRDCQRVSGGPYTPVVLAPAEKFRVVRGTVRHHLTSSAAGGHHIRGFCADCGSRLTGGESEPAREPKVIGMTVSSLDDPSWFKPTTDLWVGDAQPWDSSLGEPTEKFECNPPA